MFVLFGMFDQVEVPFLLQKAAATALLLTEIRGPYMPQMG